MGRIFLGVAVAALVFSAGTAVHAQTPIAAPADIVARKQLNIALFAAFPPMAYKNVETNELVGIDVDLANYLGKSFGIAVGWQETS